MVAARICKKCGCIYSRKAGMRVVNKCPVCESSSKQNLNISTD